MPARLNRGVLVRHYDGLIARFSNKGLANAAQSLGRAARRGDNLPVFIVGMPRSGTTLIEQILSSHPAVAAGGELGFWTNSVAQRGANLMEADKISAAAENYVALLRTVGPSAARVTDKSPWNFQLLWLLSLAFPEAHIIHCRRSPLDTCLSIYSPNFARQDFRGTLAIWHSSIVSTSNSSTIGEASPRDRFTEVQYETLVADSEAETRRLIAFVGLDWDDECLAPERNPRVVGNASSWQARQPVYKTSVERWRRYEPWLGELRDCYRRSANIPMAALGVMGIERLAVTRLAARLGAPTKERSSVQHPAIPRSPLLWPVRRALTAAFAQVEAEGARRYAPRVHRDRIVGLIRPRVDSNSYTQRGNGRNSCRRKSPQLTRRGSTHCLCGAIAGLALAGTADFRLNGGSSAPRFHNGCRCCSRRAR